MRTPLPSSCGIVGKTQVVFWDFSGDSTRSLEWGYQFFRCILVFGRCLFWNLLDVFKYDINPRRVTLNISTNQPNEVGHLTQSCPRRWHCGSGASRKLSFLRVIFFEVSKTERDFTRRDFCFFCFTKGSVLYLWLKRLVSNLLTPQEEIKVHAAAQLYQLIEVLQAEERWNSHWILVATFVCWRRPEGTKSQNMGMQE